MTTAKRKISLSLDHELVAELEAADQSVSAQVNKAIRDQLARKRRQRLLSEMLDRLDKKREPVDEALVEKYVEILE